MSKSVAVFVLVVFGALVITDAVCCPDGCTDTEQTSQSHATERSPPIAIATSAVTSAGASLTPSPTIAVEAGDVVLVRSDPRDVPRIIALSRASCRKMVQNLWWAAGYDIAAIPLAAGVQAPQGILLPPAFAAVLMSASTVIVAMNAQLLRRVRL